MGKRSQGTENHVKDLVKAWFDTRGAWSYAPVQTGLGVHGIHDRVGCVPKCITQDMVGKTIGLFVSVESKRPGRRSEERRGMTSAQFENLKAIIAAGGVSIVCDGKDDLDILTYLVDGSISTCQT